MRELTREEQSELAERAIEWELARKIDEPRADGVDPLAHAHAASRRFDKAANRIFEGDRAFFFVGDVLYGWRLPHRVVTRIGVFPDRQIPVFEPLITTDVAGVSTATYSTSDFMAEIDDVA